MKYMGSKNRIAREILPIMLAERRPGQCWFEPFVGGGNMIDKVNSIRIGSDINPFVIDALKAIRDCASDLPKSNAEFTEDDYRMLRKDDNYKYKGYAGFSFSYAGKWLGGWSRGRGKYGERDYVSESYRNAAKQSKFLNGVELVLGDYLEVDIPPKSVIYCDPPYKGTTNYKHVFSHEVFWQWCRDKALDGHNVFVSEYLAPIDFKVLFEKKITSSLTKNTGGKIGCEKLFGLI